MDLKQVIFFFVGLVLVPVWTCKMNRCYEEHELKDAANRKLWTRGAQKAEPHAVSPAPGSPPPACPVKQFTQNPPIHLHARSLSPWRYILVTMEDHFPSTYAEAQCLCSGCILIGEEGPEESYDYNSVPVKQSRVFLKKERCDNGNKYYLTPVKFNVTVGCTCARPKTSS